MSGSSFSFDIQDLLNGMANFDSKKDAALRMFAESAAKKLEQNAKSNAKWTDRTGDARRRLNSGVAKVSNGFMIHLAHGVSYGIYLEKAHEKRYEIIQPTIEHVGTFEIMPAFQGFIEKMNGGV